MSLYAQTCFCFGLRAHSYQSSAEAQVSTPWGSVSISMQYTHVDIIERERDITYESIGERERERDAFLISCFSVQISKHSYDKIKII